MFKVLVLPFDYFGGLLLVSGGGLVLNVLLDYWFN